MVALLAALGFVSGFGAAPQASLSPRSISAPEARPRSDTEPSRLAASHSGIPVDALPVFQPSTSSPEPEAGERLTVVTKGEIAGGQSLAASLSGQGISPVAVQVLVREMRPVFDFRHSQPGDRYRMVQDPDGGIVDFRYSTNPDESFHLFWEGDAMVVRSERAKLTPRVTRVAGVVQTSLYHAIRGLGEHPQLASDFADLFAWDIDFSRSVQPGDSFKMVYERLFRVDEDGGEDYVRPGRILAARYTGGTGEHSAFYFEPEEGKGGYYRADGESVEREFLVAPLKYSRISSTFSSARRHPILKVTRPHHGIDYAAPEGTPRGTEGRAEADHRLPGTHRPGHGPPCLLPGRQGWPLREPAPSREP
jgi:murein DD-endopeptidase MepM/ murein hydrolase activator NlpD